MSNILKSIGTIFKVIIVLAFLIPIILNTLNTSGQVAEEFFKNFQQAIFLIIYLLALCVIFYLILKPKLIENLPDSKFLILFGSVSLIIGFISIFGLDSILTSDFKAYHLNAIKIINGEINPFENFGNLYYQRPLIYLVPLYSIFGSGQITAEIYNVFLHTFTGILFFLTLRKSFENSNIARVTIIIFYSIPFLYLMLNVTNHDIPGLFFTSLFYFIAVNLLESIKNKQSILRIILLSLAFSTAILLLHFQRNLGTFVFLAIMTFSIILIFSYLKKENRLNLIWKTVVFFFVIPFIIYTQANKLLNNNVASPPVKRLFMNNDTRIENVGDYKWGFEPSRSYWPHIARDKDVTSKYGLSKFFSEAYYNYYDLHALFFRKMNRLYSYGDDVHWALRGEGGYIDREFFKFSLSQNKAQRLLLNIFIIIGAFFIINKVQISNYIMLPLIFWFFLGNLLLISETQPRYSYTMFLNLSAFAAIGILSVKNSFKMFEGLNPTKFLYRVAIVITLMIAFVFIGKVFTKVLLGNSSYVFLNLHNLKDLRPSGENFSKDELLSDVIQQERNMKYGIKLPPPNLHNNFTESYWKRKAIPGNYYIIRGFIRYKNDAPKNLNAVISAENKILYQTNIQRLKGRPMKYKKNFRVGYFETPPVLADDDFLDIKFTLFSESKLEDKEISNTETFLEFVHIDGIGKNVPDSLLTELFDYSSPKQIEVSLKTIFNSNNVTMNFMETKKQFLKIEEKNNIIQIIPDKNIKGRTWFISGGAGGAATPPAAKKDFEINQGTQIKLILDGKFQTGTFINFYFFDSSKRIGLKRFVIKDSKNIQEFDTQVPNNTEYFRIGFGITKNEEMVLKNVTIKESESDTPKDFTISVIPEIEPLSIIELDFSDNTWFDKKVKNLKVNYSPNKLSIESNLGKKFQYVSTNFAGNFGDLPELNEKFIINSNSNYKMDLDYSLTGDLKVHLWVIYYNETKRIKHDKFILDGKEDIFNFKTPIDSRYYRLGFRISGNGILQLNKLTLSSENIL